MALVQPSVWRSRTIGELELLDMLQDPEARVFDSRTPDWFAGGSIPGAVNMPYTEMPDRLDGTAHT